MKKFLPFLLLLIFINACSDESENSAAQSQEIAAKEIQMFSIPGTEIINQKFAFSADDSDSAFANQNAIINAVNESIKCTLNPKNKTCTDLNLPQFILMEDESLQRPTKMQYTVTKLQPLNGGLLHVHTQSSCNNNWFGLCQGHIVYVLQSQNGKWFVSDIFALETNWNEQNHYWRTSDKLLTWNGCIK